MILKSNVLSQLEQQLKETLLFYIAVGKERK